MVVANVAKRRAICTRLPRTNPRCFCTLRAVDTPPNIASGIPRVGRYHIYPLLKVWVSCSDEFRSRRSRRSDEISEAGWTSIRSIEDSPTKLPLRLTWLLGWIRRRPSCLISCAVHQPASTINRQRDCGDRYRRSPPSYVDPWDARLPRPWNFPCHPVGTIRPENFGPLSNGNRTFGMAMAEPLSIAAARGSSRDIVREIARSIRPPGPPSKRSGLCACMHLLDEACFVSRHRQQAVGVSL